MNHEETVGRNESTTVVGAEAEDQVAAIVRRKGWRVLARNFRYRRGEIDLIAEAPRDGMAPELVFVEVRSRAAEALVDARASVDHRKRRRLEAAAQVYLSRYRGRARSVRFDVFARDGGAWTHLPGAW